MMIFFALVVTVLISITCFYLLSGFQREAAIRSAEFNLRFVADAIEQDLLDLETLGKWCGGSQAVADYFLSAGDAKMKALASFSRIQEELRSHRANLYVQRLIVMAESSAKVLQIGNFTVSSIPVNAYNVNWIRRLGLAGDAEWGAIVSDPFYNVSAPQIIPLLCPVYNPDDRSRIGTVFLAAASSLITDKLNGYSLEKGSGLYLELGGRMYRLEGGSFVPAGDPFAVIRRISRGPVSAGTVAAAVEDGGRKKTIVSYPIRQGIYLSQTLSGSQISPPSDVWLPLLAALCVPIFLLAMLIATRLDKWIGKPVAALHVKIGKIGRGDFSAGPEVESDTELGQVGEGVSRLARDVVALMDSRVADEKRRQDLEYRMLQSQISPHFLYNTLGTIKWMAAIQGADGIAEITTALSRLLRTVANDIRKTAPLREELKFLDDYIVIQKYRYGDSISFEKEIEDESLLDYAIPKLTLQPFVENAIFHGLEPKGGGRILIRVARDGGDALISLTDNGVGMGAEAIAEALGAGAAPGTRQGQRQERTKRRAPGQRETRQGQRAQGETAPTPASEPEPERQPEPASAPEQQDGIIKMFGIKNVDERLRHAFGPDYGVSIVSEPGSYTTACVRVPPAREEFP